jgi:hypothetical protein
MPGWVIWLGEPMTGIESLFSGMLYGVARLAWRRPTRWPSGRSRRVAFRRQVVVPAEFDDPKAAATLARRLNRELQSGRLPDELQ